MAKCGKDCEVYSRVCGYFRPVANFNLGKKEEFKDRKVFSINGALSMISRMSQQAQELQKRKKLITTNV